MVKLGRFLTTTVLAGASVIASPVRAQETPATEAPATQPETQPAAEEVGTARTPPKEADIVITGTRIPQPNLTSASPVTVLSSQDVKLSGTTRTEDLINSLPQAFASQGSNISNGATGIATIDLRGLGSQRTLVLINGRRLMSGDPRQLVADVNFVPSALVKRVDVLTGGASSVYGADAVAGVVNFIIDTNFRGLRVDAQASTFMHYNATNQSIVNANAARGFRPPHGWDVNGGAQDVAVAFGAGFDDNRGSVTAYATYRKQDAVLQATRDYSFCALQARATRNSGTPPRDFDCAGSATSNFASLFTHLGSFHVDGNQFLPGTVPFNFAPYNYYQRPDERYTMGAFAEYEISPGAKPYLEAMFMDDRSDAQIAPSGDFTNTTTLNCDNALLSTQQRATICRAAVYDPTDAAVTDGDFNSNFGNLVGQQPIFGPDPDGGGPLEAPLLGFTPPTAFTDPTTGAAYNRAIAYVARRNVEGGGRDDDLEHTAWRLIAGVRGDLLRGLSYDAYYQFGTSRLAETYLNDFSISRMTRALDVVANPAVGGIAGVPAGTPVCRAALPGTAPGGGPLDVNCVPWNIFQNGGVTAAALDYLQTPGFQRGNINETIADANVTLDGGEYGIQSPWSDHGIGLNVGGEYRKEALHYTTDTEFQTGDLAGQGTALLPVDGKFDVREAFAELQLPIVSHRFFEELTLGAGYRYSDYKVAGHHFSTNTYKLSVEFAPIHDVRIRGSYNRAVRAPNVVELFAPQAVALGGTNDPCAGAAPTATLAQCQLTGVSSAQYGSIQPNPANQYNALFGGNPDLTPEKADSYTLGVVVQPRFVPGLALTVDYYKIDVANLISPGVGFQTVMAQCLNSNQLCGLIHRVPGNGSLWLSPAGYIESTTLNVGALRTAGLDFNGSYTRRVGGLGSLNATFVGTYLKKLVFEPLPDAVGAFDCKGFFGATCGTPKPSWRHKFRLGFTFRNGLGISGQWRYFSAVHNDTLSSDADLNGTGTPHSPPGDAKYNAQSYFDLALSARIADRYNFRLGANNILDSEPPVSGQEVTPLPFGTGNTFPQVYDALGRFLFAGITVDF
jgi:outer membrane receptor protein involved in Fe transport